MHLPGAHSESSESDVVTRGLMIRRDLGVVAVRCARGSAGRPGYAALVKRGGLNVLAVVVAADGGRWATEVRSRQPKARAARRALQAASLDVDAVAEDRVVELAMMEGWRSVTGAASHAQSYALMTASLGHWEGRQRPGGSSCRRS